MATAAEIKAQMDKATSVYKLGTPTKKSKASAPKKAAKKAVKKAAAKKSAAKSTSARTAKGAKARTASAVKIYKGRGTIAGKARGKSSRSTEARLG